MKKRLHFILCFLFLLSFQSIHGQPRWVDYSSRNALYPTSTYLTGFYSEGGLKKAPPQDRLNSMAEIARKQLIESIQVSIKSVATLEIQNINRKTMEKFRQSSISVSQAEVVGLKTETFFDKKRKSAFAFSYVSKSEVIEYHSSLISQKINDASAKLQLLPAQVQTADLQGALIRVFEVSNTLKSVEKSQLLLLALGIREEQTLMTGTSNQLDASMKQQLASILNHEGLSATELAMYLAFELREKAEDFDQETLIAKVTFQDSELESSLSAVLNTAFTTHLTSIGKFNLAQNNAANQINATFWEEKSRLRVVLSLSNTASKQVIASAEGYLPQIWLAKNGIQYLPEGVRKLRMLAQLELTSAPARLSAKLNQPLKEPLTIKLSSRTGMAVDLSEVPVKFYYANQEQTPIVISPTDNTGLAKCYINKLATRSAQTQVIFAAVDIQKFSGLSPESPYFKKAVQELQLSTARFVLDVSGPTVAVITEEMNLGQKLGVPFIEPALKEALSEYGYTFIDQASGADYMLRIKAQSRSGSSVSGIYFSYVDATISLTDLNSGQEVYKGDFTNIKGGGNDFSQAGVKAFREAAQSIKKDVVDRMVK